MLPAASTPFWQWGRAQLWPASTLLVCGFMEALPEPTCFTCGHSCSRRMNRVLLCILGACMAGQSRYHTSAQLQVLCLLSEMSTRVAPTLVILVHRAVLTHIPESTGAAQRPSLPVRAAPAPPGQVPLLQLVPDFVLLLKAALAAPDQDAQQLKVSLHC